MQKMDREVRGEDVSGIYICVSIGSGQSIYGSLVTFANHDWAIALMMMLMSWLW